MRSEGLKEAVRARKCSHSPYSGHAVGAAIRTRLGRIVGGCNVENSSYGATVCAERVAVQAAVAQEGTKLRIEEVWVVTDPERGQKPWAPCGLCRQVLLEFVKDPRAVQVHLCTPKGITESMTLAELTPRAFTPKDLR